MRNNILSNISEIMEDVISVQVREISVYFNDEFNGFISFCLNNIFTFHKIFIVNVSKFS